MTSGDLSSALQKWDVGSGVTANSISGFRVVKDTSSSAFHPSGTVVIHTMEHTVLNPWNGVSSGADETMESLWLNTWSMVELN